MKSIYGHIYFEGKNLVDAKDEVAADKIMHAAETLAGLERGISRFPDGKILIYKDGKVNCVGFPDTLANVMKEMLKRSSEFTG